MMAEIQTNWRFNMRKTLKWIGIILGGAVAVLILAVIGLSTATSARLTKTYEIQPEILNIPSDPASLAEGERLASIYCGDCHGENFSGTDFFNDPALAVVDAPNLTSGAGGIGAIYTYVDWVRAIRHGIDPNGKALFIMPAKDFYQFNNEDLSQIIAFLKTAPAVDNHYNDKTFGLMGKVLLALGAFGDVLNTENIDHNGPRPESPKVGVSAAYGEYLAGTYGCQTCHGQNLSGGANPEPNAPPGPNLTPGGNLGSWSETDFINIIQTRQSAWMTYESLAKMTDDELSALWAYLESLPALETTTK
jgi:mono/diheme cytochrome c family protein